MGISLSPPAPVLPMEDEDSRSITIATISSSNTTNPTSTVSSSNSLVSGELPLVLDDQEEANVLLTRRLLISMQKSDRSRKGLDTFERESRNTHGANSEQLKKRPMFLDPPDDCRSIAKTRRKKKPFKKKITMKRPSSSSSSSACSTMVTEPAANLSRRRRSAPYCRPPHREWCDAGTSSPIMNFDGNSISITYHEDGITTTTSRSWKQMQHQGRRRAMSPCPPVPPAPLLQKVIDLRQQDLESIDSSFDSEENDLLMLEPIELSEDLPPELEQIVKSLSHQHRRLSHQHRRLSLQQRRLSCQQRRLSYQQRRLSHQQEQHAHQHQPQACFRKIRSVDTRDCNLDNCYSAIQQQHQHRHPPQHQQHFSATMHQHHHQLFHNYPRYYPNAYPGNENAGAEFVDGRNRWCWY